MKDCKAEADTAAQHWDTCKGLRKGGHSSPELGDKCKGLLQATRSPELENKCKGLQGRAAGRQM